MPPQEKKLQPAEARIAFLADRMALLMVDLVRRDCDFGRFCFDEFYKGEVAGYLRNSKEYLVCIDFVRKMLRRHDNEMGKDRRVHAEGEGPQGLVGEELSEAR